MTVSTPIMVDGVATSAVYGFERSVGEIGCAGGMSLRVS
jgi:ABC-type molybdate transport system permease subunit